MIRGSTAAGAGVGLATLIAAPAAQAEDLKVKNLNTSGPGSFRQAILDARADADFDRITFKSKLSGTIDVNDDDSMFPTGLYIEGGDLEIIGPGARKLTLSGDGTTRVLHLGATFDDLPPIDVTISGLRIADGAAITSGGGINSLGDVDLTLSRVVIDGNRTAPGSNNGGGIAMYPSIPADAPTLVVEDSTISGNSAAEDGGGMYTTETGVSIRNSTISGNTAVDEGGGAYLDIAPVEIRNSTVTANQAGTGGGLYEAGSDPHELRGTIVAGNRAPSNAEIEGEVWSVSFSLIGDVLEPFQLDDQGGNLFGVDPKLKPLRNNGGATNTHAFKKSPAKNKGPSDAPNSDQRGAPRKGKADIGAYELTKCEGVIVNRVGTAGKDKLKGTKKKDGILGLGGNDKLSGKKGKDGLCGGQGKDKLKGGPGKDKLDGGPGKDKEIQ